jgi:ribosome-binding factor A
MAFPSYKRAERVSDSLREELSLLLLREVKDPRLRAFTVTRVQVSEDLRHAKVYVAGPGGSAEGAAALAGLGRATGYLRGALGRRLRLRHIPELTFLLDTSVEASLRIQAVLRSLAAERSEDDA